jgi:hypothetical protein
MLLKHRLPQIDTTRPFEPNPGFEHMDAGEVALLRWLKEHRVDFVLVGSSAQAVHSGSVTAGPLAIVPAPYRRNLERLSRALSAAEARVRNEWAQTPGHAQDAPAQLSVEDLMRDHVWALCCGPLPLDVVGTAVPSAAGTPGASDFQELLYEATRFEITGDVTVEVASAEDIEHYAHLRRTGTAPQITISRRMEPDAQEGGSGAGSGASAGGDDGEASPGTLDGDAAEAAPTAQSPQGDNGQAPTAAPHPDSPPGSG